MRADRAYSFARPALRPESILPRDAICCLSLAGEPEVPDVSDLTVAAGDLPSVSPWTARIAELALSLRCTLGFSLMLSKKGRLVLVDDFFVGNGGL